MPASLFVFSLLIAMLVLTLLLALILLVVSCIWKRPSGTYRRLGCLLSCPILALGVFLFSIMVYDSVVAGLTNTYPNFSDWEQAGIAKHYILRPGSLYNKHSDEYLVQVDALYIDEEDAVVVSSQNAPEKNYLEKDSLVYLYRFEYKDNQCKRELLDSAKEETQLWDRYATTHSIDRNEIKTTYEMLQDVIWWHLPLNAFLALITALLAVYVVWRRWIKKKQ